MWVIWQHKRSLRRRQEPLGELSFLFNRVLAMELDYPEIWLEALGRAPSLIAVLGAFLTTHENQTENYY
jgi:hypothetical protein